MAFTHLHLHTEYSLQDAMIRPKKLAKKLHEIGQTAVAITDHGFLYNNLDTYRTLKKEGIKPVLGLETYVAPRLNTDKISRVDNANYHLVLLAETEEGYKNIKDIASDAAVNGFYYRPRTDKEKLKKYHNGVIALSACLAGEVQRAIMEDDYKKAKTIALEYDNIFGRGNFFLELQNHGIDGQTKVNAWLIKIRDETGIPIVVTNDCHYVNKDDYEAHDILMAMQAKTTIDDENRKVYTSDQFYVKSEKEMRLLFPNLEDAFENIQLIVDRCNVEIEFGKTRLPPFNVPMGYTQESYLRELVYAGAENRYSKITKEIKDRIEYELNVVNNMGYPGYFLIVWDKMRFCKEGTLNAGDPINQDWRPILMGPGRGSGAGSIMAYCLWITQVDPLKYGLMFERFLDPSRISLPDFDIDSADNRRQEIIEFFKRKYGENSVCQIITFSTLAARAVIRGVGRALAVPYSLADEIAKSIPQEIGMTIEKALEINHQLRARYESDKKIRHLLDVSIKLEGLPFHSSVHAAGVLVTGPEGVQDMLPVSLDKDGNLMTQYDKNLVEDIGGCKFDELGLKTLGIIDQAFAMIERNHGIKLDLDELYKGNDLVPFKLIQDGLTEGIFQCEGKGMTEFLSKLKPQNLEDLSLGIAMFRPGSMQYIPQLLENRKNPKNIKYLFPALKDILGDSNGVLCYQEQCMQTVIKIAGYDKSDSDSFRKVIGKKIASMLPMHKKWFIDGRKSVDVDYQGYEKDYGHSIPGGVKLGFSRTSLENFFHQMEEFAKYSFNKSHSCAYAALGTATAFLAYYYPSEYFSAIMNYSQGNDKKIMRYMHYCKKIGIEILPPDVNHSCSYFNPVSKKQIVYSLNIKNASKNSVIALEQIRGDEPFTSIYNFIARMLIYLNKDTFRGLVSTKALTNISEFHCSSMMAGADDLFGKILPKIKKQISEKSLSVNIEDHIKSEILNKRIFPDINEYPPFVLLSLEKFYLGHYLTGHPLLRIQDKIEEMKNNKKSFTTISLSDIEYEVDEETGFVNVLSNISSGEKVKFIAIINKITIKTTKKKELMAIIDLEDLSGIAEGLLWPNMYSLLSENISEGEIYVFDAVIKFNDDQAPSIIINDVSPLDNNYRDRYIIHITTAKDLNVFNKVTQIPRINERNKNITYIQHKNTRILLNQKDWFAEDGLLILKEKTKLKFSISKW